MTTSQYLSLAMSSLVVGGAMLLGSPAEAAILSGRAPNTSSFPLIGNRFVLSGVDGRPLNVNSASSAEFPITQIASNANEVSISTFGGIVQPGDFSSFNFDIADNPDGTAAVRLLSATSFLATPTGIQEQTLPVVSFSSGTSAGARTPFSAFRVATTGDLNGAPIDFTTIFQVPGDQINLVDASFGGTFEISSQAIPGYVPVEQLNNFSAPVQVSIVPGGSATVTNPQAVPEPTTMIATGAAVGFGAFFKRKSSKNNTKAIG